MRLVVIQVDQEGVIQAQWTGWEAWNNLGNNVKYYKSFIISDAFWCSRLRLMQLQQCEFDTASRPVSAVILPLFFYPSSHSLLYFILSNKAAIL